MKNSDVVLAWAQRRLAVGSHLHSDGDSLFSYEWYEIARHAFANYVVIRHSEETYSRSTARHISAACSVCREQGLRTFEACGTGMKRGTLGEPDWSWIVWRLWFDAIESDSQRLRDSVLVRIKEDAKVGSKLILNYARDHGTPLVLSSLSIHRPYHAVIKFKIAKAETKFTLDNGYSWTGKVRRLDDYDALETISVRHLTRVHPPLATSTQLMLPTVPEDERWEHELFDNMKTPLFAHMMREITLRGLDRA